MTLACCTQSEGMGSGYSAQSREPCALRRCASLYRDPRRVGLALSGPDPHGSDR